MKAAAAIAALILSVPPAFAVEVAADCTWRDGGVFAIAPSDNGNGKLLAGLGHEDGGGGVSFVAAFVDCKGEMVGFDVASDENLRASPYLLGPTREVAALADDLAAAGIPHQQQGLAALLASAPHAQTPFCGCAIYYPDSPGAQVTP